jgi:hypothetical protein
MVLVLFLVDLPILAYLISVALAATRYAWRVSFLFKHCFLFKRGGAGGGSPPALSLSKYALQWCFSQY